MQDCKITRFANLLIFNLLIFQSILLPATEKPLARIYFDFNSSLLSVEARNILSTVADKMRAEPNLLIDVNGYTDSIGTISYNLSLSKNRAAAVKRYLVDNLKINSDRIYIEGYGTCEPIASDGTEDGRKQNRRVDIMVREPDALLSYFRNQVMVQPPSLIPEWVEPTLNYYLYRLYKVNTGRKSGADILFPGKGVLRMDEEALVIIHGLKPTFPERLRLREIELQSGGLMAMLEELSAKEGMFTNTPAAVVKLHSKSSKVTVDKELKTLVSVYDGYAEVTGAGKKVIVNKGEGTVVRRKEPPQPPRPLPLRPTKLFRLSKYKKLFPSVLCPMTFAWQPTARFSRLQIARDSEFREIVIDTCTAFDSCSYSLKEGTYYWRVSGIDENNLEGPFSISSSFTLEMDTIKPPLATSIVDDERRRDAFVLEGKTEPSARVRINGKKIKLTSTGRFSYPIPRNEKSLYVQAFDEVGNLSEYRCRVPPPPFVEWGVEGGITQLTQSHELRYWYGVEVTYILWFNSSVYFDTGKGGPPKEKYSESPYFTKIIPMEIGFRQEFGYGWFSPFFHTGPGIICHDKGSNMTIGMGGGVKLYLGVRRVFKFETDYTYPFGKGSSLISYRVGFQFRM